MSLVLETQKKKLKLRSVRRGIREKDLILGAFAALHLSTMSAEQLSLYERLLQENDHDLYDWITGQSSVPTVFRDLIKEIATGYQQEKGSFLL